MISPSYKEIGISKSDRAEEVKMFVDAAQVECSEMLQIYTPVHDFQAMINLLLIETVRHDKYSSK